MSTRAVLSLWDKWFGRRLLWGFTRRAAPVGGGGRARRVKAFSAELQARTATTTTTNPRAVVYAFCVCGADLKLKLISNEFVLHDLLRNKRRKEIDNH